MANKKHNIGHHVDKVNKTYKHNIGHHGDNKPHTNDDKQETRALLQFPIKFDQKI